MLSVAQLLPLLLIGQPPIADVPKVLDARLNLRLFAEAPDIVTPVGIAVDDKGRVLCIESNTHFPPADYQGHKTDRIRMFEDTDGDGKADQISDFYDGLKHTMGLAIYHDGSVYVAMRSEIIRLRDTNNDGVADERTRIAHLETAGDYPHNGLAGFAFDFAGNVYFGFGENLGADYKLIGSDGVTLSGGGEGGNIYRCGPQGEKLARIATGFWNPFHLCFDAFGRLFAVDNDPDLRPPCRLLHIVEGGDYGYRFRNGRRGTHPFTAWNGELPGTLPMVAGTGEAPSGILAYESDNLPEDYRGDLLVTSWGDHRIERFHLNPRGASFGAEMTPVVTGGENFRPVGIALAPDGSIFFSDWVDKSYNVHGKGRIWKLSAIDPPKPSRATSTLQAILSPHGPWREAATRKLSPDQAFEVFRTSAEPRIRSLAVRQAFQNDSEFHELVALLYPVAKSSFRQDARPSIRGFLDDFVVPPALLEDRAFMPLASEIRAAGLRSLAWSELTLLRPGPRFRSSSTDPFTLQAELQAILKSEQRNKSPATRLSPAAVSRNAAVLQALLWRRSSFFPYLPSLLSDPNPDVRFIGIQWIGEERLKQFRPQLEETMLTRANTRRLFEACVAALEMLDGVNRKPTDEWRGEDFVAKVLLNEQAAPAVRLFALRTLRPNHPQLTKDFLDKLLAGDDAELRLEAIRSLCERPEGERAAKLRELAADEKRPAQERAEAIVGLSSPDVNDRKLLFALISSPIGEVSREALRGIRGCELKPDEREAVAQVLKTLPEPHRDLAVWVLMPAPVAPPKVSQNMLVRWLNLGDEQGNAEEGARIFFNPRRLGCFRCHEVNGRGANIGPELTTLYRVGNNPESVKAAQQRILESIAFPSREVAPHFAPWIIETKDGQSLVGLLAGEEVDGTQRYVDATGIEFRLKPLEIERRVAGTKSIMPEGLTEQLTAQEFRDLLAFLLKDK